MLNKNLISVCLLILVPILSSCSVHKAASNEGVSVSDIRKCRSKGCFLSRGMTIVDGHQAENGKYVETYRAVARKSGGNYVRAIGHGVLDVATLGLWEVAGTPIEGAISNNRGYIVVRALYPYQEANEAELIEIHDANGNLIK